MQPAWHEKEIQDKEEETDKKDTVLEEETKEDKKDEELKVEEKKSEEVNDSKTIEEKTKKGVEGTNPEEQTRDIKTPVEFESEFLAQYFLDNYDNDLDNVITDFDMAQIEELYLPWTSNGEDNPESLIGLEYCINLQRLYMYSGYYKDLSAIAGLTSLTEINIKNHLNNLY